MNSKEWDEQLHMELECQPKMSEVDMLKLFINDLNSGKFDKLALKILVGVKQ